jgi:hypothetical protein
VVNRNEGIRAGVAPYYLIERLFARRKVVLPSSLVEYRPVGYRWHLEHVRMHVTTS